MSDKTIVKLDPNFAPLKSPPFCEMRWQYVTSPDGNVADGVGLYVLVDGGYYPSKYMIAPRPHSADVRVTRWSDRLESVRKDVECFFGVLRKRFCILCDNFRYPDLEILVATFKTCCWIHNEIFFMCGPPNEHDLQDVGDKSWEDDVLEDVRVNNNNNIPLTRLNNYEQRRDALINHLWYSES